MNDMVGIGSAGLRRVLQPSTSRYIVFLLSAHLLSSVSVCLAIPTVLINSGKARCVTVDGTQDEIVRVHYEAPDAILDRSDPHYGATYVTVNVRPLNRVYDTELHNSPVREHLKPTSLEIETRSGEVSHQFEVDGIASICLRASMASANNVMAFGWRIVTSDEMPSMRVLKSVKDKIEVTTDVDQHLTHMESELQRITNAMNHVLKEADLNRHQDEALHQHTLAMHNAATFWPIVQVCVLLMTGFTQASHIVQFFKSRRII